MGKIFIDLEKIFDEQSTILVIVNRDEKYSAYPFFVNSPADLLYVYSKLINYDKLESIILSYLDPVDKNLPWSQQNVVKNLLYNNTVGQPKIELDLENKTYRRLIFESKLCNNAHNEDLNTIIRNITNH